MLKKHLPSYLFMDEIADTLFDRMPYPANASWACDFFQQPIGVMGKGPLDTNMLLSGTMPVRSRFLAASIEVIFLPHAGLSKAKRIADVNAAARSGVVRFRIQNRVYLETAPLAAIPATSYWHSEAGDNECDITQREMLRAQLSEQFRETDYGAFGGEPFLMVPVFIDGGMSFAVEVSHLANLPSGKDGQLWCRIKGRRMREAS